MTISQSLGTLRKLFYLLCHNTSVSSRICNFIFLIQHVSIHSKSLLTVHPQETNKSSMYYVMQMLKGALPTVLVKVIHFSFLLRSYLLNICVGKGVISSLPRKRFLSKDFLCSVFCTKKTLTCVDYLITPGQNSLT